MCLVDHPLAVPNLAVQGLFFRFAFKYTHLPIAVCHACTPGWRCITHARQSRMRVRASTGFYSVGGKCKGKRLHSGNKLTKLHVLRECTGG